jgi:lysophospholipase L1-like esterase
MSFHFLSLALGLAIAAGALPTSAFAHSATEPVPRSDGWWKERHESFNKRVTEVGEKAQVVFIGDSITQGWEGEGKAVWATYYAHRNAVNLGIGGDRTQHVLWRLDNGNLSGLKPKAAVLMIGTNNSNGEDNSPGQIVEGVRAIVQKLREKLPDTKILLLAIFPRSENYSVARGKLAQINQALRRAADEKEVFWVDFGHRFLNDDGTMPRDLMPDYLHLSPRGYAIWAESIEGQLSRILGDSKVQASNTPGASGTSDLTGTWTFTIPGPDGQPVSMPLELKQTGANLTGRVKRGGGDAWLDLLNGRVNGNEVSWIIKRDRTDGTIMTYDLTGRVEGTTLLGKAKTSFNGNDVNLDWTARR